MTKRERNRIRKYWNKPAPPVTCAACGGTIDVQPMATMAGCANFPYTQPACPHCGSREGYSVTFMTGTPERDATTDINTLLDALESK